MSSPSGLSNYFCIKFTTNQFGDESPLGLSSIADFSAPKGVGQLVCSTSCTPLIQIRVFEPSSLCLCTVASILNPFSPGDDRMVPEVRSIAPNTTFVFFNLSAVIATVVPGMSGPVYLSVIACIFVVQTSGVDDSSDGGYSASIAATVMLFASLVSRMVF